MDKLKELADKLNEACECEENPGMKAFNWSVLWKLIVEVIPIILKNLVPGS